MQPNAPTPFPSPAEVVALRRRLHELDTECLLLAEQLREARAREGEVGRTAYELANLFTAILGHAWLAQSTLPTGTLASSALDQIAVVVWRATALARQLLAQAERERFTAGADRPALVAPEGPP